MRAADAWLEYSVFSAPGLREGDGMLCVAIRRHLRWRRGRTSHSRASMTASVLVVGGGQAGLAAGYFLTRLQRDVGTGRRRATAEFEILDDRARPGGAWQDTWESLRLFSPAVSSSLPGMRMPAGREPEPSASEVVDYLHDYEMRYGLPIARDERVERVARDPAGGFIVSTSRGMRTAAAVIMATGSWGRPFIPAVPGAATFQGRQLHARDYRVSADFAGRRVAVVGGGNSGAQIAADLDMVAAVTWVTNRPPAYLPDEVDGRALFAAATQQVQGSGRGVAALGDIVALPPVRAARDRGLRARWDLARVTKSGMTWADGSEQPLDAIIWCTGFRPDLAPLRGLRLEGHGGVPITRADLPTASASVEGLYFLGYGDWCGAASATLVGVGRMARSTVADIAEPG